MRACVLGVPNPALSCSPMIQDIGLLCDMRSIKGMRESCFLFSNEAKPQKVMK